MAAQTGILLVNLGTPDAPQTAEVRRYLREFLSDPRVLDINPVGRWLLLNLVILLLRPARSAAAYRKIWGDRGSPLLAYGRELAAAVAQRLDGRPVELAMRYGNPSLGAGIDALREAGCRRIVAMPLYPQYASSTTGSTVEAIQAHLGRIGDPPALTVVPPFYDDPRFIEAFARVGAPVLEELDPDHVVMSFHGLPERHLRKQDPDGLRCLTTPDCCDRIDWMNRNCYRAHCFATARAIASALEVPADGYTVSFQSRLGRDPWIRPYTDAVLQRLPSDGARKVAVFCPAFVADCLETLEEIGITGAEAFVAAGGEALRLVPSLNAHAAWIDAVVGILGDHLDAPIERRAPRPREDPLAL